MRFFFHLRGGTYEKDDAGTELSDGLSARREAIRYAGEIIQGEPALLDHGPLTIEVHDESGGSNFTVKVRVLAT